MTAIVDTLRKYIGTLWSNKDEAIDEGEPPLPEEPPSEVSAEVSALIQRRVRVVGEGFPPPGTPEDALARRLDRRIREAIRNDKGQ